VLLALFLGSVSEPESCIGFQRPSQGELTSREYHRTITASAGKKSVEHVIQQFAVEVKADTVRVLDRTGSGKPGEPAQTTIDEAIALEGLVRS